MKRIVVIGFLGTTMDNLTGEGRWSRWRPTVSIGQHEDFLVSRLDLLVQEKHRSICETVCADFHQVSPETDIRVHGVQMENPWDFETVYTELLTFAREYPFDTEKEEYLVHITTGSHVMQICLFLLVESRHIPAKILQTSPDRRGEIRGTYSIIDLDLSKYDKIAERFRIEQHDSVRSLKSGIETRNAAFNRTIEQIARVSLRSDGPILLLGPTGVGKTQMAKLIYNLKRKNHRVTGRFVEFNCATLRGRDAMSALFGHKKGAYAGATTTRAGLLAAADEGVLFLDEVGELGLDEQSMLLKALEERKFYPLGSDEESRSAFGLICSSSRDLKQMVAEGRFRADLLARIRLWTFRLAGLKDRPEDLEPNIAYELEVVSDRLGEQIHFNKEAQTDFLKKASSPDALWNGNFRDLSSAVMRMAVMSENGRITLNDVHEEWSRLEYAWESSSREQDDDEGMVRGVLGERTDELDLFDIAQLACVIRVCRRSATISNAGRTLFARSLKRRTTTNDSDRLRKYLAKFGLSWADVIAARGID